MRGESAATSGSEPAAVIERVARAMAVSDGCDPDEPAFVRYPGAVAFGICWRDKYAHRASAAIDAMRIPTDAMIEAYCLAHEKLGFHAWANLSHVLPAVIDAALGLSGGGQEPSAPGNSGTNPIPSPTTPRSAQ